MKKYYDKNIHDLIEKSIKKLGIDKDFEPYVIDILMRRAYQFEFSEDEIQTDLDTLNKSLKNIKVEFISMDASGQYSSSTKTIQITPLVSTKQSYSDLAHELYHACTHDEDGRDRLGGYNLYLEDFNYCLLEAFVERASYRTIYNTTPRNPYSNINASGYEGLVFVIDMLSATYGVKENDLLKHGIQSRSKLIEFLSEKSGNNYFHTEEFLDMLEMNYTAIHNSFYDKKKQKITVRGKNVAEALGKMSKLCFDEMNMRFAHINYEDLTPEVFENIKFDYNKLNSVIDRVSSRFFMRPSFAGFTESRVEELIKEEALDMKNGIIQTEYLKYIGLDNLSEQIKSCISWVRWGNGNKIQKVINESIPGLPERDDSRDNFDISKEVIHRIIESPIVTDSWDNSIVNKKYSFTFLKKILQIPIEKIRKVFSKKVLSLPEPSYKHNLKKEQTNFSWKLNEDEIEEVRKYDKQLKEICKNEQKYTTQDYEEEKQDDEMEK